MTRRMVDTDLVTPSPAQVQVQVTVPKNCSVLSTNTSLWLDSQQVLGYDLEQLLYLIHAAGFIPFLFLLGAPLNLLNMVVFFKQGLGDRINVCLFTLALLDLTYLVLIFIYSVARAVSRLETEEWADAAFRFSIDSGIFGLYGISYGPYFLSALIATERCVCVLFPLKARQCISTKALVYIIVTGVLILSSLRVIVFARFKMACVYVEQTDATEWAVSFSDFDRENKEFIDVLDSVLYGFITVIGSTVVVIITTVITAIKLQHIVRWRGQATTTSLTNKEIGVIKVIIYLSIEFIILAIPKICLRLSYYVDEELSYVGAHRNLYAVFCNLSEFSSYLSSVVNFLVYFFSGSKFRETLYSLFPCQSVKKKAKQQTTVLSVSYKKDKRSVQGH